MPKFDRYLLGQLMVVFGFFALVLVSIYWVNRAVSLFDQLISDGQTALVFLQLTALTLPNVIARVLPMAAFAAAVYVGNRLVSDSELVVVQATGYSPWRLARPVAAFGLVVAVLVSILTHLLVPLSYGEYARRQTEIAQNVTARLLTEGTFLHPAAGVTFYIRTITRDGELRDVFLSDATDPGQRTSYTAQRALIVRSDTGPKLVMFEGQAQTLRLEDRRLAVTGFSEFSVDIGGFIEPPAARERSIREVSTWEAMRPDATLEAETGASRGQLLYEGHNRTNQALQAAVTALVGFAMLLVGNFSRFGLWRQVVAAVVLLIVLKSFDNALASMVRGGDLPWPATYAATLAGFACAAALLWSAARPALFARRRLAA